MDEPLASLDDGLKQQILPYLENLKHASNIPIIYVTHSIQEVSRLADNVVLIDNGKVRANGPINQVFAATDCGKSENIGTVLQGTVTGREEKWKLIKFSFADSHLWLTDTGEALDKCYRIRIPAKDVSISLCDEHNSSILNRIPATIESIEVCEQQATCLIHLRIQKQSLVSQITQKSAWELSLKSGMQVWAQIKSAAILR
jgi:molybdate transport system ATP-binding protein